MSELEKQLDYLEVEFLTGVPVNLPAETKRWLLALIKSETDKARIDEVSLNIAKQDEIGMHDCCYGTHNDLRDWCETRLAELQNKSEGGDGA